jgi:hypothetical protein
MKMEQFHSVLEIALWGIVAAIGWFARQLWDAVSELRRDLHDLEVTLPTNYIRRDEFQEGVRQIREDLQIIFQRLDDIRSGR